MPGLINRAGIPNDSAMMIPCSEDPHTKSLFAIRLMTSCTGERGFTARGSDLKFR